MNPELLAGSRDAFRRQARTFWLAARLLPAATGDDAAVVCAFCRMVGDTADEALDAEDARLALQALSNEI